MVNVFAVPVFFVCFRECLETSIIVSVLLSFIKQTIGPDKDPVVYKKLLRQVWLGVGLGLVIILIIGAGMIGAFYGLQKDVWGNSEDIWEGVFSLIASIIITIMGAALLRVSKLQDKWRVKIARAIEAKDKKGTKLTHRFRHFGEKYAMFLLPFITVLREGLEAVVFIGGVGVGMPASSFPIAVITGLLCGILVGFIMYKGGNAFALQIFLIISTCFLYLVAAGLFSKAVWDFEINAWNKIIGGDAAEVGSGPGSYNIRESVWHVNCCNAEINGGGGWGIFNALFGWENSATYGSVISYNLYWIVVSVGFLIMGYNERRGHWPFMKPRHQAVDYEDRSESASSSNPTNEKVETSAGVQEVRA
jgi:high-affinity iron transporter